MKTEDLIRCLVQDARPVQRLASVRSRATCWFAAAAVGIAAGMAACGLRKDIGQQIQSSSGLLQAFTLLVLAGAAGLSAFQLSVPDLHRPARAPWISAAALTSWVSVLLIGFLGSSHALELELHEGLKPSCVARIVGLGFLPFAMSVLMLREAAVEKPALTGFMAGVGAFGAGALGTQALCNIDRPLHIFVWHVLPLIAMGLLGSLIGLFAMKRQPHIGEIA